MDERDNKKRKLNPESASLHHLHHFGHDILSEIFGHFDVPEMKTRIAGIDRSFHTLITKNLEFIRGYNIRDVPLVWSFNHCITQEQNQYGVLYGFRIYDRSTLRVKIRPRVHLNESLPSIRLVDVSGNFSLFRLGPVNNTLLVINPFGPTDYLIDMPDPLNLFDTPHHISITADFDHFRVLCIVFVNDVPIVHCYDSRRLDDWAVHAALPWVNFGQNSPDLGNCVTMVHNDSLYTMGFRIIDDDDGRRRIPFYTVSDVMSIDDPNDSSWYYFDEWALMIRSYRSRTKLFRIAVDINMYQRTSFIDATYLHVCTLPGLQHFKVPIVLDDCLTAKVFDGIVYIQLQITGTTSYPTGSHLATHVLRYDIACRRWLPTTVFPFSPVIGVGHASPRFASRLTLPLP